VPAVKPPEASGGRLVVAVGSLNQVKVRSVRRVLGRFYDVEVVPVAVETSVSRQPIGSRDLVLGSLERALGALASVPSAELGVGVEAGLMEFYTRTGFIETQVAVIVDRSCRASLGLSPSFELSPKVVELMLQGYELSQAAEIPRGLGDIGELVGYIGYATGGLITRQMLTEAAIAMALAPRLWDPSWLITVEELSDLLGVKPAYECTRRR